MPTMTQLQIIIAIAVVVAVATIIYTTKSRPEKSKYEAAKESLEFQPGAIRQTELPSELIDRIRRLQTVFSEVYPISHQEWLDGFQRDQVPENEVAVWEQMASAYTTFLGENDLEEAARQEAFRLLLVRSSTSSVESELSKLEQLTVDQARSLVALYQATPKPITIQDAEQAAASDAD